MVGLRSEITPESGEARSNAKPRDREPLALALR